MTWRWGDKRGEGTLYLMDDLEGMEILMIWREWKYHDDLQRMEKSML